MTEPWFFLRDSFKISRAHENHNSWFLEKTFPADHGPQVSAVILKLAVQHPSIKQVLLILVRSAGHIKIGSFKVQRKKLENILIHSISFSAFNLRPSDWNLLGSKNQQKKEKIINFQGCCAREKFYVKSAHFYHLNCNTNILYKVLL